MSKNWSTDNVKNIKKCYEINPENGKRDLSLRTMFIIQQCESYIGIPCITDENYESVYDRLFDVEEMLGQTVRWEKRKSDITGEDEYGPVYYPVSLDDVKNLIGLTTNGPVISDEDWSTKVKNYKEETNKRVSEIEKQFDGQDTSKTKYVDMREVSVVVPEHNIPKDTDDPIYALPGHDQEK